MLLRIENVGKQYRLGNQMVVALHDITLNVDEGSFIAIAGPSGSGKSTLLNIIGLIDTPTTGRLLIDERAVAGNSPDELAALRARTIGFVFQTFNLLPVLSARENVEYPLLRFKNLSKRERQDRVAQYLDVVGLRDFARHRPDQLSGGQRQRVAIARALAIKPKVVLADEPTANLDHVTGKEILRLMRRINRSAGTTFIFSTHDRKVINMADRLINIEDGSVKRLGVKVDREWTFASPPTLQ
jgi:putative ABC transport system ATP-binding protein